MTDTEALAIARQVINLQQEVIKNLTLMMMATPVHYPKPTPGSIDADGTVTMPEKEWRGSGGLDYQTAKKIEEQNL